MAINDVELTKQYLIDLNKRIGEMEQEQGAEAHKFFNPHLSDQLIFHRASGKVVGKSEPEGFLDSLKNPSSFTSRVSEDISTQKQIGTHMQPIIAPIKPDGSGPEVANLQDALLVLLKGDIFQARVAPDSPTVE